MQRVLAHFALFLMFHVLTACGPSLRPPPTYPHEDPAFGSQQAVATGLDHDEPAQLVLLPGDIITVRTISNETAIYENLIVDSEGKVHVPVIGAVQVAGLAPQQAERTIEGMMQKVDRFVRVSVLVTQWSGHFATVIGAVGAEGAKIVTPGMRLAELVAAAGGLLRTTEGEIHFVADLDGSKLVRDGRVLPVSLRLALTGDPRHNVFVHAGDQLFVPAGLGNRIAVFGKERTGAMIDYRPGMRVTEAIAAGGGFNIDSDAEDIRIVRGPIAKPLVYKYDLEELIDGKGHDVELAPGDVVFVTRHWSSVLREILNTIQPILSTGLLASNTVIFYKLNQQRK